MRLVVQRVKRASVEVGGERIAQIESGLLLLVGIAPEDVGADLAKVASKIVALRIFEDDDGKMNRSLRDVGGSVLAVSQFTLYGDTQRGRRPSFSGAALPEVAEPLFDEFVRAIRALGVHVEAGQFGAKMAVELTNDGPVTLVIEVAPAPSAGYTAALGETCG
jgi:D-tyrosyl-tRNA(Tyr) deacylase